MNENIQKILLSATNSKNIQNIELIQDLWSGYGSLSRVTLDYKSIIIKLIKFPQDKEHPKGWNSSLSHQRKVRSYQIEMNWYKNYNKKINYAHSPRYIASGEIEKYQYLILEDLKISDFTPRSTINEIEVKLCLKWLANFHAYYLNVTPEDLWKIGTYWNLETRPDEYKSLLDKDLAKAAPVIDKKLNSSKFKTIVHGDAKLANFLFSQESVSAVDFQYVGGGTGVKDVAYFLSSIYGQDELLINEEQSLNYYFKELKLSLDMFNKKDIANKVVVEWTELYPFAWADFYRFLSGWSPGHPKINSYSEGMKNKVLNWI